MNLKQMKTSPKQSKNSAVKDKDANLIFTQMKMTLPEILPMQPSYFLLFDGKSYAQHGGSRQHCGVLVFTDREQADHFYKEIGYLRPEFQPVEVSCEDFVDILECNGGRFCVRNDSRLIVCQKR